VLILFIPPSINNFGNSRIIRITLQFLVGKGGCFALFWCQGVIIGVVFGILRCQRRRISRLGRIVEEPSIIPNCFVDQKVVELVVLAIS
jgi:hypothetical protein